MNSYLVRTKDERLWHEIIDPEIGGPHEPYWPCSLVVAETAGKAKFAFLKKYAENPNSGVYSDDYPNLRTQLLERNVSLDPGFYDDSTWALSWWLRVKPWRKDEVAV